MDRRPNYLSKQLVGVGIIGLVLLWSSPQLADSLSMLLRLRFDGITNTAFCMVPIVITGGILLWGSCYGLIRLALQKSGKDNP